MLPLKKSESKYELLKTYFYLIYILTLVHSGVFSGLVPSVLPIISTPSWCKSY